eukprot:4487-Pelagomonas_calceolata.AAC.3
MAHWVKLGAGGGRAGKQGITGGLIKRKTMIVRCSTHGVLGQSGGSLRGSRQAGDRLMIVPGT